MPKGYIYSLSNKEHGVFYIGSSTQPNVRAAQHKKNKYFDEIAHKFVYFYDSEYTVEIVDEMKFRFREELEALEDYWIHQFYQWGFPLRNKKYNRNRGLYKVPCDIQSLLKKHSPSINPYRTVESDEFVEALYKIIRNLQTIINGKQTNNTGHSRII